MNDENWPDEAMRRALEQVIEGGGPRSAEAADLLGRIAEREVRLSDLANIRSVCRRGISEILDGFEVGR